MKAFSNHSVGISRSQERCSVKLESAAISSRGPVDGHHLFHISWYRHVLRYGYLLDKVTR
jgi:hypothetical protein